jgi:hypothetical protein
LSGTEGGGEGGGVRLGIRDYLALFLAALETVGLPLLVFIAVVFLILILAKVR